MTPGWRGLGLFWLALLVLFGAGAALLQVLGPPAQRREVTAPPPAAPARTTAPAPADPAQPVVPKPQQQPAPAATRPGRDTPGPVADPDPALLQPGPDGGQLPRIAADGRMPMQVYAAGFDQTSRRARIGLILAGIGLDTAVSIEAIRDLPRGVTLVVSPYAASPQKLLDAARFAEHEYLLALPMEPQSFPLNDPGPRALMTSLPSAENLQRLRWLLSRIAGYVGVTNALGGALQGERFAATEDQMNPVLQDIAGRGLLYIDARPNQAPLPLVWSRDVDLVVDQPATEIEAKLTKLERIARNKGSALGIAVLPRPVTVQRIVAWADGLAQRGFILAPVSALVDPPHDDKKGKK